MPSPGVPLERLGFLTIGLFDGDNPGPGHQTTLEIIELGERLGFDSAWLRDRHLQYGISSPVAVLAAASQRTSRIELGTAVIPLGWENPLRLAEDRRRAGQHVPGRAGDRAVLPPGGAAFARAARADVVRRCQRGVGPLGG
jgi:alkanesulfonate monooxygenase SsuD/methylene tetrahydromethanopterin reductase-like flavin-dependent oxidoreductase (luciferase family)